MRKHTQVISNDLSTLVGDARALLDATADVTGAELGKARQRLAATLDSGRTVFGRLRGKAAAGAKSTDRALHQYLYPALALAVGVGALLEYLVTRRWTGHRGGSPAA